MGTFEEGEVFPGWTELNKQRDTCLKEIVTSAFRARVGVREGAV